MSDQPQTTPPISDVNPPAAPIPTATPPQPAPVNEQAAQVNPTQPVSADAPTTQAPASAGTASAETPTVNTATSSAPVADSPSVVSDDHDNDHDENDAPIHQGEHMIPMSSIEQIIKDMQFSFQTRHAAMDFAIKAYSDYNMDKLIDLAGRIEDFLVNGAKAPTTV